MATATLLKRKTVHGGGGMRVQHWSITFVSDATVELNTGMGLIYGMAQAKLGSGGDANALSIDETADGDGNVTVPATGAVTIDATASNTNTYLVTLFGE